MMLSFKTADVSLASFREQSAGKKVVLLYPWTNYRLLFLSNFLENAKEGLLYYAVPKKTATLQEMLADLIQEFELVLGQFGKHLRAALPEGSPENLGEALAADLAESSDEPLILFIDNLGCLSMTVEFGLFLERLVQTLAPHIQIALGSHMLKFDFWNALVMEGRAIVLGNEQHRSRLTFNVEAAPKPQLEIVGFGAGIARINGQEIVHWDGMLPRNLFFYLIDHPLVTRDEIFADFWPKVGIKDATDIFHVTKHKVMEVISRRIGNGHDYEITQYKQGFYLPSDKLVRHYDVELFETSIERAINASSDHEAEILLARALDLYKGPFFTASEMLWAKKRREALARQYSEGLIWLGRLRQKAGDTQEALRLFTLALAERPEREDIHRAVIQLYLQAGRIDDAKRQYHILQREVYERIGIAPSNETLALGEEIERVAQ